MQIRLNRLRMSILTFAIGLFSFSGHANAETWEMATAYPEGNFHTKNVHWFVDRVEELTDGELTINVHSGASLFAMAELKRALRTRQVPMAEFFLSAYGNEDPIYEIDSLPFLATNQEEARQLYKLQKPLLEDRFEAEGLVPLYSVPWPGNTLYTKDLVESVDELAGVRMRGQTAIVARLAELVGANPVDVQFVDVPQAFETGVIEAMWTAGTTGVDTQSWEYTNYFYDMSAYQPKNIVAVNAEAWNSLSEDVRSAVMEASKEAEERGWQRAAELQTEAKETLAENGMKIVEPSPTLKAELAEIGKTMTAEFLEDAGPDAKMIVEKLNESSGE